MHAKATTYIEFTAQKVCRACYHRTMEVLYIERMVTELGRTYEVVDFRLFTACACKIQVRYRKYVRWKLKRMGPCCYCVTKPVRLFCFRCKTRSCHTCAFVVHAVKLLKGHKMMRIELYKKQRRAVRIISRFTRRIMPKIRLRRRFGTNIKARRNYAATQIQKLWRGKNAR